MKVKKIKHDYEIIIKRLYDDSTYILYRRASDENEALSIINRVININEKVISINELGPTRKTNTVIPAESVQRSGTPDSIHCFSYVPFQTKENRKSNAVPTLDDLKEMIKTSGRHASSTKPDIAAPVAATINEEAITAEEFKQAVNYVLQDGQISISTLQRRMALGYRHTLKIIDKMYEFGIIAPKDGYKPWACLITQKEWEKMKKKLSL